MPKGPAIAVLPFTNLSGDPKQDYFSDGLTEDILTELSRARDLRVLARNTSFQYKGKAVDVRKLGRELERALRARGQYPAHRRPPPRHGAAHRHRDRCPHLGRPYDREMADVFLVQDEIVSQIVAKIAGGYGVIESSEAKSPRARVPEQIQAYDLVLRARDVMHRIGTAKTFARRKNFCARRSRSIRRTLVQSARRHGLP